MRFDNDTIAEEVAKIKGRYVPVKSGALRVLLVKFTRCSNLHPNPDDEFSMPQIGPNYGIVSNYEKQFRQAAENGDKIMEEPLIVERIYPSGYMLLNGHHRWAAAQRMGIKYVPIQIVNLPQEHDVEKMIKDSQHNMRVVMDLDEVVYTSSPDEPAEPKLHFPYDRFFKERLRHGIPALFRFFEKNGYDIWLYSSELYSLTHVQLLFKKYHVHVDGILTGTKRKGKKETQARLAQLLANKYTYTYHLDSHAIVMTSGGKERYNVIELDCTPEEWSAKVIDEFKKMGTSDNE